MWYNIKAVSERAKQSSEPAEFKKSFKKEFQEIFENHLTNGLRYDII